jgi:CAAX protease family protein
MSSWTTAQICIAALLLTPVLALAFAEKWFLRTIDRVPRAVQLILPTVGSFCYWVVTVRTGYFQPTFVLIYAVLPVVLIVLLWHASNADPEQRGNWRDLAVLAALGLIVEFRSFEFAWPQHVRSLNRLLLFDTGLYGFLVIRRLTGVGFNLWPRLRDFKIGLRELAFYAPIAIPLGLGLGFLHAHRTMPGFGKLLVSFLSIFAFVALLEETYFRGWVQNLLERRIGQTWALLTTATLFGLSHFNKGATHFNWRYVLLATFAGIFYGRAWRAERRLFASALTHALVDTIWLLWFR